MEMRPSPILLPAGQVMDVIGGSPNIIVDNKKEAVYIGMAESQ